MKAWGLLSESGAWHQGQCQGTLARRREAAPGGAAGDRVGACGRLGAEKWGVGVPPPGAGSGIR